MELSLTFALIIIFGAFVAEFIDSSLGMLYGTILSPALIIAGFEPILVVPSILFSQAFGGFTASIFHHRLKNANLAPKMANPAHIVARLTSLGYAEAFKRGTTRDLKVSIAITALGVLATVFAALIAVNIPKIILKTYIGVLVILMGAIILSGTSFQFSWKKIMGLGILSAFNKGFSGGGFGPIVTAGQIISGRSGKNAIGATALAEAPICIAGFLTYFLTRGVSNWNLPLLLSVGALGGAAIGPFFTAKFKSDKKLKLVLGFLVLLLGAVILINSWFFKIKGVSS